MNIAIKLSRAERIRRAVAADPALTNAQLRAKFGVSPADIKIALKYRGGVKAARSEA